MAKKLDGGIKTIVTGDYMSPNKKMLVAVGDHRREWVEKVSGFVPEGNMTEVFQTLIDLHSVEDPEAFAAKVMKHRLKKKLDEIEREEKALAAKKAQVVESLQNNPITVSNGRA